MPNNTPPNIHDKFFRSTMAHHDVAVDFVKHHFPKKIVEAINLDTLKLLPNSYIDTELQQSISDLVFSCEIAGVSAYLVLLVEHQSRAEKMLPFRVFHYVFSALNELRKAQPNKPLPPVYPLVFYHGRATPYPYSLALKDCFNDPLNIMFDVLSKDILLIDVNQLSDEELKKQHWIGPLSRAMKYIREQDITPLALDILTSIAWQLDKPEAQDILNSLLKYLLRAGNIKNINLFIKEHTEQLTRPVRSAIMTAAEQLEAMGMEKGLQKGIKQQTDEIALKMLHEGTDLAFITRITGLSTEDLARLQQK